MSKKNKYKTMRRLVERLRDDLNSQNFVLIYAYNGTGKTRLSMEFKDKGKKGGDDKRDTLYFNAFTEDLFYWDNDLENDKERLLKINASSNFFSGFKELALEEKIFSYLERYADINFKIDYENWTITFTKPHESIVTINELSKSNTTNKIHVPIDEVAGAYLVDNLNKTLTYKTEDVAIKISRGEERLFIWCIFLAICQLVIDSDEAYKWVKYIYIDDPVSSMDDNNVIAVASDLSQLIQKGIGKIKFVISTHHHLFFNVMYNELKNKGCCQYFFQKNDSDEYTLRSTNETPFFHHVALLSELKQVTNSGNIKTHHFNSLRSILEKTAVFFGYNDFSKCIHGVEDEVLYARALNLLSHGKYSIYEPIDMADDNKQLFTNILNAFLGKYEFYLPEIFTNEITKED